MLLDSVCAGTVLVLYRSYENIGKRVHVSITTVFHYKCCCLYVDCRSLTSVGMAFIVLPTMTTFRAKKYCSYSVFFP